MASIRMYLFVMPNDPEMDIDWLMMPFNDYYECCETFAKNCVAYGTFLVDDEDIEKSDRKIYAERLVIDGEVQIFEGNDFTDDSFWTNVVIPRLCEYYETDEINDMVQTEISEEALQTYDLLHLLDDDD